MAGVEGYVESCAMGLLASLSAVAQIMGRHYTPPPADTALGALINYLTASRSKGFQPMNINFGLFWVEDMKVRDKKIRNQKISMNAINKIHQWKDGLSFFAHP